MTAQVELWPEEIAAARERLEITVSEWADEYRVLDPLNCSRPGPWRTDVTPYLREIMDAASDRRVSSITLMGPTQWGKSETMINILLWSIDQDPVPTLYVLPTEDDVKSFNTRRLKEAIDHCPRVARHRTQWKADWKQSELAFHGMVLYYAWANSASRLSSRSIGRLFMDEVDKYPQFSGRESSPIKLANERLRWFSDALQVYASTPTTTDGYIWRLWNESDKRKFHAPCPKCGIYQTLEFSRETVVWPAGKTPDQIRDGRLASYVCQKCDAHLRDDGTTKRGMLLRGVWCPEGAVVLRTGKLRRSKAVASGTRRGYHISSLVSPVLTWSEVAAAFLESKDDLANYMNFVNSWLGLPWIETSTKTTADYIRTRATDLEVGVCPSDTAVLTAAVDVQERVLYYAIRAHSPGERTHTIEAGTVESFDTLAQILFHTGYRVHGTETELPVRLACVDSGYRTDEVYAFCLDYADRCRPVKGYAHRTAPYSPTKVERDWIGRAGGLMLWHLDVSYYKDKMTRRRLTDHGRPGAWTVHADPSEEYCRQVTAEHRILKRSTARKQVSEEWAKRPGSGGNHWWDCEVYNEAAADMLGVYALREAKSEPLPLEQERRTARVPAEAEAEREGRKRRRFPKRKGWIRRRS